MPTLLEELTLCSRRSTFIGFLNASSAAENLIALNCNVCCEDDDMYNNEALSQEAPRFSCGVPTEARRTGNGGGYKRISVPLYPFLVALVNRGCVASDKSCATALPLMPGPNRHAVRDPSISALRGLPNSHSSRITA